MKKGKAIGIVVVILAISIIVGIASLPDEVLVEYSSVEHSQNFPLEEVNSNLILPKKLEESKISPDQPDMLKENEADITEQKESNKLEVEEKTETEGKEIKITISDGVGAGDR